MNIVNCKRCQKEFDYIPGPAGNYRQLCGDCRNLEDAEELDKYSESLIIEKNKYLISAPKRKSRYDPTDILIEGMMPEFKSESEKFICAIEIGDFIKRSRSIYGKERNMLGLLKLLGLPNAIVCLQQFPEDIVNSLKAFDLEAYNSFSLGD